MPNPKWAHLMNWSETNKWRWFKKWVSWNPKWQPRKWISLVNQQLKEKGYKPATKQDIETNYMHLMNLEEEELKIMVNDKKQPMMIRILIKNLLSGKGFDVIEKMLDRGIGKAMQREEITADIKVEWNLTPALIKDMTMDEINSMRIKLSNWG